MDTYDVAVVGCGPVGLTLARLLAMKGLRVAAIDPNRLVCHHPRATHLDDEIMRLLQTLGAQDMEHRFLRQTAWTLHREDGRAFLQQMLPEEESDQGWRTDYQFHQPDFESRLRGLLAADANVDLRFGWTVSAMEQDDTAVRLTLLDRSTEPKPRSRLLLRRRLGRRQLLRPAGDERGSRGPPRHSTLPHHRHPPLRTPRTASGGQRIHPVPREAARDLPADLPADAPLRVHAARRGRRRRTRTTAVGVRPAEPLAGTGQLPDHAHRHLRVARPARARLAVRPPAARSTTPHTRCRPCSARACAPGCAMPRTWHGSSPPS